jgi:hypothetical protein
MSGQNANAVHVKITGADGVANSVVDTGTNSASPLPGSAGSPVTVTKGVNSQVLTVHGQTAGVILDNPA